ncbi:unnamed protein product [Thlaspi arvense]|uniref:Uncharacterized protein n=1 Tax=Thlaspi arvense TaxID=13288 RepID=A0AAU9RMV1_THLAR|nr:unnamed protein product [Thlaspi arvense]
MASKIIFFILLLSLSLVTEAQVSLPCDTQRDCIFIHCSVWLTLCINRQCQCLSTYQAKLDNLKTMSYVQTCKSMSDCDPRMKSTCVSGSYMCFEGYCTCAH